MNIAAVVVGIVDLLWAAGLVATGALGVSRRLPRNRFVGIRTPVTLASPEAFTVAHVAAGPGLIGAGIIAGLAGILAIGVGAGTGLVFGVIGALAAATLSAVIASFGLRVAARVSLRGADDACEASAGGCGSCVLQGGCGTSAAAPSGADASGTRARS